MRNRAGANPSFEDLAGVERGVLLGLIAEAGAGAAKAEHEFDWERDAALLEAADRALAAAAQGGTADPAPAPRWLEPLARRVLRQAAQSSWSREGTFTRIRLWERLGLVRLDPDDTYVLAMVGALGPGKTATLRADPDLVERALWRVFEVEGGGEVSLRNVDRFGDDWRGTFLTLTADGTLDRGRVLEECLTALRRDFLAYRAAWYSATFLALAPDVDELADLQPRLRPLLGADVPATVSFAVKLLRRLQKAGRLDLTETLDALPAAATTKTKATALDALRLASAAGEDHAAAAARVARAGLGHPHADVQRAAADLLTELGETGAVEAAAEDLTPSVRAELGLGRPAETAGWSAAHETLAQRLAPALITTTDVAERAAALLEDASEDLESLLAALAEPGSEDGLAPLRRRAKAVLATGSNRENGPGWLPGQVAALVLTLLGEPAEPADPGVPALRFVTRRIQELRTSPGPLLATPDLPGGWVGPDALTSRLSRTAAPRHHDLVAALLRLHPDDRERFARDDLPAPVRHALLGDAGHPGGSRRRREGPGAWWVAAERSRHPYREDERPRLESETGVHTMRLMGHEHRTEYRSYHVAPAGSPRPADDEPTDLGRQRFDHPPPGWVGYELESWVPVVAAIWPHDAEHFLALTCSPVLYGTGWTAGAHDAPRVLDALARHPGRLGPLAAHTLAAGLTSGTRGHRGHAVDTFLDLVPTGRLSAGDLAGPLTEFWTVRPANRLTESLAAAAHAPGGPEAVVEVLTRALPRLPADARGLGGLLDLLRDELLRQNRRLDDDALRAWLAQHRGSSRTARTARSLLG